MGFRPGTDERRLWRLLAWTIVSPRLHFIFIKARIHWNRQGVIDRDDARGTGRREFCDLRAAIAEVFHGLWHAEAQVPDVRPGESGG